MDIFCFGCISVVVLAVGDFLHVQYALVKEKIMQVIRLNPWLVARLKEEIVAVYRHLEAVGTNATYQITPQNRIDTHVQVNLLGDRRYVQFVNKLLFIFDTFAILPISVEERIEPLVLKCISNLKHGLRERLIRWHAIVASVLRVVAKGPRRGHKSEGKSC